MAYWPIPMVLVAVLLLLGLRYGGWAAPLAVLMAYIAMRGVIGYVPPSLIEVAGCTVWLSCAAFLCYKGAWVPGFFYALSGMTYPALMVVGVRIEHMGLSPIIAAIFGLLALIGMGSGILGLALGGNTRLGGSGFLDRFPDYTLGMATRSVRIETVGRIYPQRLKQKGSAYDDQQ